MSLSYVIDPAQRLVTITVTAPARTRAVSALFEAITADPRYQPGFHVLVDRRAVRSPPKPEVVNEGLRWLRAHQASFAGSRWAIVACDDVPTVSAILAAADRFNELGGGLECRTFLAEQDARRWLAI